MYKKKCTIKIIQLREIIGISIIIFFIQNKSKFSIQRLTFNKIEPDNENPIKCACKTKCATRVCTCRKNGVTCNNCNCDSEQCQNRNKENVSVILLRYIQIHIMFVYLDIILINIYIRLIYVCYQFSFAFFFPVACYAVFRCCNVR